MNRAYKDGAILGGLFGVGFACLAFGPHGPNVFTFLGLVLVCVGIGALVNRAVSL